MGREWRSEGGGEEQRQNITEKQRCNFIRDAGARAPDVDAVELEEPSANASVMLCSTRAAEGERGATEHV
jgi:hypothetical protein